MTSVTIAPPSTQTQSFTLFPLLPPELRQLIWKHCLPCARIISVSFSGCSCQKYTVSASAPVLLYVNHESRAVARQRYELYTLGVLGCDHGSDRVRCPLQSRHCAWADWENDILFLKYLAAETGHSPWAIRRAVGARRSPLPVIVDRKGKNADSHAHPGAIVAQNGVDNAGSFQQVARIALPYHYILLDLQPYFCVTGARYAFKMHEKKLKDITKYLESETFPSLRDVFVVVDKQEQVARKMRWKVPEVLPDFDFDKFLDQRHNRDEGNRDSTPNGNVHSSEIEFVDLQASERFDSEKCQEMEEAVTRAFWHLRAERKPAFASGLKIVEVRPNEEPTFTWLQ